MWMVKPLSLDLFSGWTINSSFVIRLKVSQRLRLVKNQR